MPFSGGRGQRVVLSLRFSFLSARGKDQWEMPFNGAKIVVMLLLRQCRGLGVCSDPQETENTRLTTTTNYAGGFLWVKG